MPVIPPRECVAPLVVALDVGTSSARALLFDGQGRGVEGAIARVPYRMATTPDGGVEADADRLVEIAFECIDALLARARALFIAAGPPAPPDLKVAAVAISTFWHGLVGVSKGGRPTTPLYSWNDTRAAAAARKLRDVVDERDLHGRTGCKLHASYWPAKLAWLAESRPENFKLAARWMSVGEYLLLRLFGETAVSVSMASATGLFNQHEAGWDREILSRLDVTDESLSPLIDVEPVASDLKAEYAARWPALRRALWFPALGDGACNNVGSGCVSRERAALMVGTSGALRTLFEARSVEIPEGLWCYRADRRRFVMGGALSNGGDLFAWMRQTFRLGPDEAVERQLASMEADAHGLTVLPFLSGERSVGWNDDARAAITGMGLGTTPLDVLRAGLEAIAYRFAAIYDLLVTQAGEPREIVGSGAAVLRSPAWAQIICDVIGKPIIVSDVVEASSLGAALLALEALGAISDIEGAAETAGRVYSPGSERHARYIEARARQDRLYELLIGKPVRP